MDFQSQQDFELLKRVYDDAWVEIERQQSEALEIEKTWQEVEDLLGLERGSL